MDYSEAQGLEEAQIWLGSKAGASWQLCRVNVGVPGSIFVAYSLVFHIPQRPKNGSFEDGEVFFDSKGGFPGALGCSMQAELWLSIAAAAESQQWSRPLKPVQNHCGTKETLFGFGV